MELHRVQTLARFALMHLAVQDQKDRSFPIIAPGVVRWVWSSPPSSGLPGGERDFAGSWWGGFFLQRVGLSDSCSWCIRFRIDQSSSAVVEPRWLAHCKFISRVCQAFAVGPSCINFPVCMWTAIFSMRHRWTWMANIWTPGFNDMSCASLAWPLLRLPRLDGRLRSEWKGSWTIHQNPLAGGSSHLCSMAVWTACSTAWWPGQHAGAHCGVQRATAYATKRLHCHWWSPRSKPPPSSGKWMALWRRPLSFSVCLGSDGHRLASTTLKPPPRQSTLQWVEQLMRVQNGTCWTRFLAHSANLCGSFPRHLGSLAQCHHCGSPFAFPAKIAPGFVQCLKFQFDWRHDLVRIREELAVEIHTMVDEWADHTHDWWLKLRPHIQQVYWNPDTKVITQIPVLLHLLGRFGFPGLPD